MPTRYWKEKKMKFYQFSFLKPCLSVRICRPFFVGWQLINSELMLNASLAIGYASYCDENVWQFRNKLVSNPFQSGHQGWNLIGVNKKIWIVHLVKMFPTTQYQIPILFSHFWCWPGQVINHQKERECLSNTPLPAVSCEKKTACEILFANRLEQNSKPSE